MRLTCIAIDDEPLALSLMDSYIKKTSFLEGLGCFNSALEALETIKTQKPDIIFLDIQMPNLNGMEFAKNIDEDSKIVFTTAFDQYAIEGYKVNACDYLLKPISYKDFFEAVGKIYSSKYKQESQVKNSNSSDGIFIKADGKFVKVLFNRITYIEAVKDYIKICFDDKTAMPLMSLNRMKNIENELPENFVRIHKSFIINTEKIDCIERNHVIIGNVRIPIGGYFNASREIKDMKTLSCGELLELLKKEKS